MSWVTTITARFAHKGDALRIAEMLTKAEVEYEREDAVLTITVDYGTGSKYGPVRPAVEALREVFDPVADSEFYEPWPDGGPLELRVEWREP